MTDEAKKIGIKELAVLVLGVSALLFGLKYLLQGLGVIPGECTVDDVYEIRDEKECNEDNYIVRNVIRRSNITCLNPGKVERPDEKIACEYVPDCKEENLNISDWSICGEDTGGFSETREIQKVGNANCKINYSEFPLKRSCEPTVSKQTVILKDYTTEVDPVNTQAPYKPSRDNLLLEFGGQFKSIKLIAIATTSFKIPEYYYFQFEISEEIPRTIGAEKIRSNRLNLNDYGIFKGTDTPAKREFDLGEVKMANVESAGGEMVKFVSKINNRNSNTLDGSLYVADGNSMIVEDPRNRIFATITEALLEYECASGSNCFIKSLK
ncbi:MAG: hypothetical protein PHH13_01675 [Candidatus Peribacteraceae bacterium]|nr:hypothetical protein [Candidatus Peribacteraceae bacterium]